MTKLECNRCGHEWIPNVEHPKQCPECNSPYWDKPRVRWDVKRQLKLGEDQNLRIGVNIQGKYVSVEITASELVSQSGRMRTIELGDNVSIEVGLRTVKQ
jgi:DNA-directed RNA polymerase subunit RPC12/RpoP